MIKIGTDICSVQRIADAYSRHGERFLRRILTEHEIAYVLSSPLQTVPRLAGRFAAKEAASKVLGTGWRGLDWKDIEIRHEPSGEPRVKLHGRAIELANRRGLATWEISVSHEREFAVAFVLAHGKER